jgi:hypothetical protein
VASKQHIHDAKERLGHIADVYWGINSMSRTSGSYTPTPDAIVERVLADYAIGGGIVPIDTLKKRAQERLKKLDAPKS